MGTYTTNKELFMPTVGEQGWGTLVNGNFETIDSFLKPITVSGSTYTFTGNHVGNQSGGSISATSITNSGILTNTGTSTFTGKITANGGIGTTSLTTSSTITSTGKITANGGIGCKALTATSISNSGNMTNTGTLTSTGKIYANGGIEGVTSMVTESVYANVIYLPLKTSGTVKVFGVNALNASNSYPLEPGWSDFASPFTIPEPLLRTPDEMSITCTYSATTTRGSETGGIRYYEDGILKYTFLCPSSGASAVEGSTAKTFTIPLRYGSTYNFQAYASAKNNYYPLVHKLTSTELAYYII